MGKIKKNIMNKTHNVVVDERVKEKDRICL